MRSLFPRGLAENCGERLSEIFGLKRLSSLASRLRRWAVAVTFIASAFVIPMPSAVGDIE